MDSAMIRVFLALLFMWCGIALAGDVSSTGGTQNPQSGVSEVGGGVSLPGTGGVSTYSVLPLSMAGTPPDIFLDFTNNTGQIRTSGTATVTAVSQVTVTRASSKTNLISTSASGFAYSTFGNNILAMTPGLGALIEESRTNFLLNSAAPATQTTGTLANGTYTLWVNGGGTATMSAGTATGCGTSAATQGSPISFTTSGTAGTCTVTVSGSLNAFQLELNPGSVSAPTSLIVTAGATATRAADVVTLTTLPTVGAAVSMFVLGTPLVPTNFATGQIFLQADNGGSSNEVQLYRTPNANVGSAFMNSGGVTQYNVTSGGVIAANSVFKFAGAFAAGAQNSALNNTALAAGSGASLSVGISTMRIGSDNGPSRYVDGFIGQVGIWTSQALSSAVLQSMTM